MAPPHVPGGPPRAAFPAGRAANVLAIRTGAGNRDERACIATIVCNHGESESLEHVRVRTREGAPPRRGKARAVAPIRQRQSKIAMFSPLWREVERSWACLPILLQ
jgi:hypothetical protein